MGSMVIHVYFMFFPPGVTLDSKLIIIFRGSVFLVHISEKHISYLGLIDRDVYWKLL